MCQMELEPILSIYLSVYLSVFYRLSDSLLSDSAPLIVLKYEMVHRLLGLVYAAYTDETKLPCLVADCVLSSRSSFDEFCLVLTEFPICN